MKKEKDKVPIEVEFTDGYQERFTKAIMKIYYAREKKKEQRNVLSAEKQEKVS